MMRKMVAEQLMDDHIDKIKRIAREHGAVRLRVFGSQITGQATASSDLDLLVDFETGRDLLDLVGLKQDLEALLGIQVDILEEEGLSPYLRERILREAKPL
jgi:uncharacterized protein